MVRDYKRCSPSTSGEQRALNLSSGTRRTAVCCCNTLTPFISYWVLISPSHNLKAGWSSPMIHVPLSHKKLATQTDIRHKKIITPSDGRPQTKSSCIAIQMAQLLDTNTLKVKNHCRSGMLGLSPKSKYCMNLCDQVSRPSLQGQGQSPKPRVQVSCPFTLHPPKGLTLGTARLRLVHAQREQTDFPTQTWPISLLTCQTISWSAHAQVESAASCWKGSQPFCLSRWQWQPWQWQHQVGLFLRDSKRDPEKWF